MICHVIPILSLLLLYNLYIPSLNCLFTMYLSPVLFLLLLYCCHRLIPNTLNVQLANIIILTYIQRHVFVTFHYNFDKFLLPGVQSAYKRGCTGMGTSLEFGKMARLPICKSGFLVLLQERLSSSSMLKFISSLLVRLHAMYNSHKT